MAVPLSGSLASLEGMEQQGEAGLLEASPSDGRAGRAVPDAAGRIAAAASAAAAAASAELVTLLAGVAPPQPVSHLRGASSCAEARPAVPHFAAARCHCRCPAYTLLQEEMHIYVFSFQARRPCTDLMQLAASRRCRYRRKENAFFLGVCNPTSPAF